MLKKYLVQLVVAASIYAGFNTVVFAGASYRTTYLTVKNHTKAPIFVQPIESINFVLTHKVQINGTTDTPSETIDSDSSGVFKITDVGYAGGATFGDIQLCVGIDCINDVDTARGKFPLDAVGDGKSGAILMVGKTPSSRSNEQYACSVIPIDPTHAVLDVSTPFKK